jgi:hypothetical protein
MAPSPTETPNHLGSPTDERPQATLEDAKNRPPRWRLDRDTTVVLLVSVLFTLPIWLGTHPPMTDYPEHLSMASILRWYHDPARHLVENYTFAFSRPNTAFVFLVAALSYLMPLGIAGQLLMSVAVVATGLAGLALARHAGRPGWYGLFALIAVYNYAFFFGFVNYILAVPLFVYGIVLADRLLGRPMGWRGWIGLAVYGASFYFVHLQVLFLFVCVVGWLAMLHSRRWRDVLPRCSALLPVLLVGAFHFFDRDPQAFGYRESQIYFSPVERDLTFDRILAIPRFSFGEHTHNEQWLVFLAALLSILWLFRLKRPADGVPAVAHEGGVWTRARSILWRHRFATLGAWFLAGYLFVPSTFIGCYVYQRLVALVWFVIPALLPRIDASRSRLAKVLVATAVSAQLLVVSDRAVALDREARDGYDLIRQTEPGKSLISLVIAESDPTSDAPPPFLHFAAHYLAAKGGRISSSFSELFVSSVQLRPGQEFEDIHTALSDFEPALFRFDDFGYHFDYFLFHGDFAKLGSIFGHGMRKLTWKVQGEWALLWRQPQSVVVR